MLLPDEFSSQSDSSAELTDMLKAEGPADLPPTTSIGKCRALYTYEARLNDELNLSPGKQMFIHTNNLIANACLCVFRIYFKVF